MPYKQRQYFDLIFLFLRHSEWWFMVLLAFFRPHCDKKILASRRNQKFSSQKLENMSGQSCILSLLSNCLGILMPPLLDESRVRLPPYLFGMPLMSVLMIITGITTTRRSEQQVSSPKSIDTNKIFAWSNVSCMYTAINKNFPVEKQFQN